MLVQVTILVLSIIALYFGAEFALDAAERVGRYFGMPPLVIGLLLIGFGTSLPEFFVSQIACFKGESSIALGNIIGSNIANLFLIMGVSGIIAPLYILQGEIKRQMWLHLLLTSLLACVVLFLNISPLSTAILGLFFCGYLWDTFREMRNSRELRSSDDDEAIEKLESLVFAKLIFGFVLLYFGGDYLVSSGSLLGKMLGIPTYVISAVFVAFGTSFPELVTALIACMKKKNTDLITGNIIGSNIFNVAFVMGSIGVYDFPVKQNFNLELMVLGGACLFLLALVYLRKNFGRLPGVLFLSGYAAVVYHWMN